MKCCQSCLLQLEVVAKLEVDVEVEVDVDVDVAFDLNAIMRQGCASMGFSCATATTKHCDTLAIERALSTSPHHPPTSLDSHDDGQLWLNETGKTER